MVIAVEAEDPISGLPGEFTRGIHEDKGPPDRFRQAPDGLQAQAVSAGISGPTGTMPVGLSALIA